MSQTTCQLIGSNTVTNSNLASSVYATTAQVAAVTTTGSITSGTTALTVASSTGINNGDSVTGEGITPGTTVVSGAGSTSLTLSANAAVTLSSKPVSFFSSRALLTPGNTAGQLCKAWVNFNGTGTVAIRASYNVSSITDNGVGDYTVNFTTAMPDANYAVTNSLGGISGASGIRSYEDVTSRTPSLVRFITFTASTSAPIDPNQVNIAIFR